MSERGEAEVIVPVTRPLQDQADRAKVFEAAVRECRRLVTPHGGRVLACIGIAHAETAVGELAVKFRFVVEAPERVLEQSWKVFSVGSSTRP